MYLPAVDLGAGAFKFKREEKSGGRMGPNQKPDLGRLGPADSHHSYLFKAIRFVKRRGRAFDF